MHRLLTHTALALSLLFAVGLTACEAEQSGCTNDYDCAEAKVCNKVVGECQPFGCANCSDDETCDKDQNKCVPKGTTEADVVTGDTAGD